MAGRRVHVRSCSEEEPGRLRLVLAGRFVKRHSKLLGVDHGPTRDLLKMVRETPGVKSVRVASGIRNA